MSHLLPFVIYRYPRVGENLFPQTSFDCTYFHWTDTEDEIMLGRQFVCSPATQLSRCKWSRIRRSTNNPQAIVFDCTSKHQKVISEAAAPLSEKLAATRNDWCGAVLVVVKREKNMFQSFKNNIVRGPYKIRTNFIDISSGVAKIFNPIAKGHTSPNKKLFCHWNTISLLIANNE